MARYAVEMNRSSSTTASVGSVVADPTRPRRGKVFELILGSEAAPVDNAFLWVLDRCTAPGTSTAVTPRPLDLADSATEADAGESHSVEPTYSNTIVLSVPLNQRATFRWTALPGRELVYPATASNGFGLKTPTAPASQSITATLQFEEQ